MANKKKVRGSSKVVQAKGSLLSTKALARLERVGSARGVRIDDWCIYGQPAPDGFCGRLRVNRDAFRSTVTKLLRVKELREWKVLINGQPPRIDEFQIDLQMGRHV